MSHRRAWKDRRKAERKLLGERTARTLMEQMPGEPRKPVPRGAATQMLAFAAQAAEDAGAEL